MSTAVSHQGPLNTPKVVAGITLVFVVLLVVFPPNWLEEWWKGLFGRTEHRSAGAGPVSAAPPRTAQDVLVGTWRNRLPSGADEEYVFEPLDAIQEGVVNRQVYVNGQLVPNESWTGKYRWWDNPLLGAADRTQLQIGFMDPVWGRKEFKVIVRHLSETALVLEGVFDHQQYQFQRVR